MTESSSWSGRIERSLSLFVGLAAILAASVSLYQAALAREQARASAWPYLIIGTSLSEGRPFFLTIANRGIGPARVRTVRVSIDGKPHASWTDAIRTLTAVEGSPYEYSWIGKGMVISAATSDTLLTLPAGPTAFNFWRESQKRLSVSVCYCSVYDECWETGSATPEAVPVTACVEPTGTAFSQ